MPKGSRTKRSCTGSERKAARRFTASCPASGYRRIRCSSCCNGSILRRKQWPDLQLPNPATSRQYPLVTVPRSASCVRPVEETAGMPGPSATLPDRFRDVEHLEEVMTEPSAALTAELEQVPGDIIILGVGGKIGPTLARLAKRAAPGKRVVGVARFSEPGYASTLRPTASNASRPISSTATRSTRCRSSPMWCSWPAGSSAPPATRT